MSIVDRKNTKHLVSSHALGKFAVANINASLCLVSNSA